MILVDTGALYALVDRNDVNHAGVKEFYQEVIEKEAFCISLPILTETWLLIDARLGTYFANTFWMSVSQGVFDILEIDKHDLGIALEIEKRYQDSDFGFIDSSSFALCEKYKIHKVITYDRKHFSIYKPSFADFLELLP
jgi:hypothetical protein